MKTTKEQNLKNQNQGITLIALVITIIVMLILVAVTITMAVNGDLFGKASNAGKQTNEARDSELEYANVTAGMTTQDLIDKYTEKKQGEGTDDSGDEVSVCSLCNGKYSTWKVTEKQTGMPAAGIMVNVIINGKTFTNKTNANRSLVC